MWQYIRRRRTKRKVQRGGRSEREDGIKILNKQINLDGETDPERITPPPWISLQSSFISHFFPQKH